MDRPYFYSVCLLLLDTLFPFKCEQCHDEHSRYIYLSASAQSFLHSKLLKVELLGETYTYFKALTNFAILFHLYSYQITQYLFVWILILRYLVQLSAHSGPFG